MTRINQRLSLLKSERSGSTKCPLSTRCRVTVYVHQESGTDGSTLFDTLPANVLHNLGILRSIDTLAFDLNLLKCNSSGQQH